MLEFIKTYYKKNKINSILIVAFLLRLISVIFSKGYGMHDDHFLVIEAAKSWVDGYDYNNWLPWNQNNPTPSGHSFFYVGIHYLLFLIFKWISLTNPDYSMYVIRLLHALYSLLTVYLSYKITNKLYNNKTAINLAWILSIAWFMPFLSVRNLVEIVSIPPILASVWFIVKDDNSLIQWKKYFLAGLLAGLAFSIRFQTSLFIAGMGLTLLLQKEIKKTIIFITGVLLSITIIQGSIDMFIWGKPFTEFAEYVRYNLTHKNDYISGNWYKYILFLSSLLIPPFGLILFISMFNTRKKLLILFIPTMIFLIFHSYFPNKQERFILPVLPMFIMLGMIGADLFLKKYKYKLFKKIYTFSFKFFLIVNFILLPFTSTTYSKKARVEAMLYLSNKDSTNTLLVDGYSKNGYKILPRFYLNKWAGINIIKQKNDYNKINDKSFEKYVLFYGNDSLNKRIQYIENKINRNLIKDYVSAPGFVDWLLYTINPINANDTIFIYKKSKHRLTY